MRPHKKKRSEEVAFHFGKNLARLRRIAGLSQEELGQRASLHRTEIGMLEHGQRVARIDTVVKLAGAMAIEPQELLDGIHWTPRDKVGGGFNFSAAHFGGLDGREGREEGRP
jgi:transcriptional regulator with XRE-family HTH domain